MKNLFVFILLFLPFYLSAQDPYLIYQKGNLENVSGGILGLGDKIIFGASSYFNDYYTNTHINIERQYVMNQNGQMLNVVDVDSTDYPGYQVVISNYVGNENHILQFGSLVNGNAGKNRMLIRKTNFNLNLIWDSIYNFDNDFIAITDVQKIDNFYWLTASQYDFDSAKSSIIVLKLDDNLNILDSVHVPGFDYLYRNTSIINIDSGNFQLRISLEAGEEFAFKIKKFPLTLVNKLYNNVGNNWHYRGRPIVKDSNTFYVPITVGWVTENGQLTYNIVGWSVWDNESNLLDTVFDNPLVEAYNYFGGGYSLVFNGPDSLIMAYSHDLPFENMGVDTVKVALLFSDLQGNVTKRIYMGGDYNYRVTHLYKFNNNNLLILTNRATYINEWSPPTDRTFVAWLIDADGNLIQSFELPNYSDKSKTVFPNPATDYFYLQKEEMEELISNLKIYDASGRLVLQKEHFQSSESIDISQLPQGVFMIQIFQSNKPTQWAKLVKGK